MPKCPAPKPARDAAMPPPKTSPIPTISPEAVDMSFAGTASALTGPIVRTIEVACEERRYSPGKRKCTGDVPEIPIFAVQFLRPLRREMDNQETILALLGHSEQTE